MKKLLFSIALIIFCNILLNGQAEYKPKAKKVQNLNGHVFPSSSYLNTSFISTSLEADVGVGMTSAFKIPGIVINDIELFSFEGQVLFVDLNIRYYQRFNPWLSMFTTIKLAGRLGTNMSTILAEGVNTMSGGNVGILVRITQTKKLNLSTSFSVRNVSANFIDVIQYFEDVIDGKPYPSVLKRVPALSAGLGVQGAYAFNPTWGIQAFVDAAYGESFEREETEFYMSGGLLGDVDLMPKSEVPIGFALGYTFTSAPQVVMSGGGLANLLTAKVGYTGSDEFELSANFTYYKVAMKSVDTNPSISKILLTLKFYF
jgi:hypothetical protein